jgi:hypothetical protein
MTPNQQQQRRRELYNMSRGELERLYAKLSGHLLSEVRNDFRHRPNETRSLVDLVVRLEAHR